MPQQPSRAHSQKDLPPSVETAYYRKCIDLRRRITDIEDSNDATRQRILRQNRSVQKMRLERAFLLEQLNKHMEYNIDDSDRSSSPPPTPTDKPLRSKRSGKNEGGEDRGGRGVMMSSAQSSPDPGHRAPGAGSYFSPQGVNGAVAAPPTLPPLHSLPALQPSRAYYDPAADNEGVARNGDAEMGEAVGQ